MKTYHGFSAKKRRRSLAIGIFDGVHRGHARIIGRAVRAAKRLRAVPAILTFDPHPRKVLSGDHKNPAILMSLEHRLRTIALLGIKEAFVVRFDKRFSKVSARTFLVEKLVKKLGAKALSVGQNFRFGRGGEGGAGMLGAYACGQGYELFVSPPVKSGKRVISSTVIRHLIEEGKLKEAAALLGRPVSVYGTVVHGLGRGHHIGFPTANLDPHHETLPPPAVYAVRGLLGRTKLKGVLHIGSRPTFGEKEKTVEVHFFNWHRKLYGREVELFFVQKLRSIRRFSGPAALTRAIRGDIRHARKVLARKG